jgi:hypothetical protein
MGRGIPAAGGRDFSGRETNHREHGEVGSQEQRTKSETGNPKQGRRTNNEGRGSPDEKRAHRMFFSCAL